MNATKVNGVNSIKGVNTTIHIPLIGNVHNLMFIFQAAMPASLAMALTFNLPLHIPDLLDASQFLNIMTAQSWPAINLP